MKNTTNKFMSLFKSNAVLIISGILAFISCFFVAPSMDYINYINFRVLAILFSLMLIVAELVRLGVFYSLSAALFKSPKYISLFLCFLAFFLSMLITNDVALVTLVPFGIMVISGFKISKSDKCKIMCLTMIFMTISANLGSMLTPIGNPQNLYLYTKYGYSIGKFISVMFPFSLVSFILITLYVIISLDKFGEPTGSISDFGKDNNSKKYSQAPGDKRFYINLSITIILFILAVLCVLNVINYKLMFIIVSLSILILDCKAFKEVDYSLLVTFVFFFVLTGNLGNISAFTNLITGILNKNVVFTGIISSQFISNVPAAMLLSAFTDNGRDLLIGTNLGGLGTLIASMASLITYRFYAKYKADNDISDHYLLYFTIVNIMTLIILLFLHCGIN